MSSKYLGDEFDIHGGGMDLKFPHHECEIAQGTAANGKSPVAYEQPVTKLKVSEIRGVESESSLKTLESRGLIEKSGILDVPGSPHQYSTTHLFLEKLDISSIEELPVLGDYFSNAQEEE